MVRSGQEEDFLTARSWAASEERSTMTEDRGGERATTARIGTGTKTGSSVV